jgi:hypothetical protein
MNTEIQSGPSFELGETHKLISASARDFAQQYIAPHVMDWDERQFFLKNSCIKLATWALWAYLCLKLMAVLGLDILSTRL